MNINNKYPDYLYGDNIKLKQIILSLVNNSIKYTKEGFIDIDLDMNDKKKQNKRTPTTLACSNTSHVIRCSCIDTKQPRFR